MTLPMDIRLASENAKFGFVYARRGLVPEAASSWFLPRLVGISRALEWTYSGKVFSPDEALEGGLVRSIHSPDNLLIEAKNIAREIIENTSSISVCLLSFSVSSCKSKASGLSIIDLYILSVCVK